MSVQYGAIGWNRQKKVYDLTLLSLLALYLAVFVGVGAWRNPNATAETLLIRALGTAAFLLLNVVLCIGPLARLDPRFLPLLYSRRHLGVTTFLLGLAHGSFALFQFHALGNVNPLVSLFISNPRYGSVADFPFQALGFFALIILFLMAATSHDFWLRNLSATASRRSVASLRRFSTTSSRATTWSAATANGTPPAAASPDSAEIVMCESVSRISRTTSSIAWRLYQDSSP